MNTTIYCNKKKIFGSFLLFMGLLMFQCARVTSPTGGPKDEIPPVMISSNPGSNTTNFKEKELSTPQLGEKTTFTVRNKVLTIKPEFELLPNTTYSINFRSAISDM